MLVAAAFLLLALPGETIDTLVAEDGVVEWAGALGLLVGAVCFALAFLQERRAEVRRYNVLGLCVLLFLALLSFVAAGEEISWGQRILGIDTPDAISQRNVQGETNFHNLSGIEGTGDRVFKALLLGLFVVLPVLAKLWLTVRTWLEPLVPLVPLGLSLAFVASYVCAELAPPTFDSTYDGVGPLQRAVTEIWEAVVEVLMGVAAVWTLLEVRARRRAGRPAAA